MLIVHTLSTRLAEGLLPYDMTSVLLCSLTHSYLGSGHTPGAHNSTQSYLVRLKLAGHVGQPAHVAGGRPLGCHARHLSVRETAFNAVFDTLPLGWVTI